MPLSLRSALLENAGFAHGFSLRAGGVSAPPFDSLNLARSVGDDRVNVVGNHLRLATDVGYDAAALFEVSQVHGAVVRMIGEDDAPERVRAEEADALVVRGARSTLGAEDSPVVRAAVVGVRVADCLPLLIADARTGAVAAVHCGWRGVAASIVDRTLDALVADGSAPRDLRAAIGPHIRACCFEVGDEVVSALEAVAHGAMVVGRRDDASGKPHVALAAIVRAQLAARGVGAAQCDDTGGCTRCDAARFYSYRRDAARSGRHLAVIVARGGQGGGAG